MSTSSAALLEGARRGEQAAWDGLVSEFSSLVWSIARGYRLSNADAADAVQMTWLRLVENLDRIRDADRLPGWLATTTRRECLQLLRRSGRLLPTFDDAPNLVIDPAPPVETALLLDERDRAVWTAFSSLGEKCRRLLRVLMASPPPGYREVSEALDMPVGSIGPTRQRCLEELRRIIRADEGLAYQLGEESR